MHEDTKKRTVKQYLRNPVGSGPCPQVPASHPDLDGKLGDGVCGGRDDFQDISSSSSSSSETTFSKSSLIDADSQDWY